MNIRHRLCLVPLVLLILPPLSSTGLAAAEPASRLGAVSFPNSGSESAQPAFLRGLAALHSFWYGEAADAFREAQALDPEFALAYWGEALTYDHPLWRQQDLNAAREALERLAPTAERRRALAPTEREKAYLDSAELLFGEGDGESRGLAYSRALDDLRRRFPDDEDAAALYSLSLQTTAGDGQARTRAAILSAAVLEELLIAYPEHPGVLHYLIHAYDDPLHAPLGLRPARVYARVAPAAPHALHMPAHIFVQLGMWDRAALSNQDAYRASVEWVNRKGLGREDEDWHSLSWLHYAYLQLGRWREAHDTLEVIAAAAETGDARMRRTRDEMAARHLIETEDRGATIGGETIADRPPAKASAPLALAIGMAALRSGELETARGALARLRELEPGAGGYRDAGGIGMRELEGLLALAEGRTEEGMAALGNACEEERAGDPPSGPPHPPKPACELLGEAQLGQGRAAEAAKSFEQALLRTPKRTGALLGAARAAAGRADPAEARRHYRQLLDNLAGADGDSAIATEARAFLAAEPVV